MPAAAVIPAPIAYIKVVAVKKLVVGFQSRTTGPNLGTRFGRDVSWCTCQVIIGLHGLQVFYFEEIRVLQAGICHEYISME